MTTFTTESPAEPPAERPERTPETVAAACLEAPSADVDPVSLLSAAEGITVDPVTDVDALVAALPDTDCVVAAADGATVAGTETLLDAIRARDPTVPVVVLSEAPERAVVREVLAADWTDLVVADGADPARRLAHRVRAGVAQQESLQRARQAVAAVDAVTEGVAIAGADGTIVLANDSFARQFGAAGRSLRGTDWRDLFADDAVDRIRSDAFAAVADGWEWIGTCEGFRLDQEPVSLQVRVAAVADEGFALVVSRPQAEDGD